MWSYTVSAMQNNKTSILIAMSLVALVLSLAYIQMNPKTGHASQKQAEAVVSTDTLQTPPAPVTVSPSVVADNQAGIPVNTKVTIDGQNVPVPPSGEVHKSVETPNGTTKIDVSVDSNSSGNSSIQSSSSVNLDVHTSSEQVIDNSE